VHFPDTHAWLEPQVLQGFPPLPQALLVFPATQLPWLSQHPLAQVVASQVTDLHCWLSQMPVLQSWQVLPPVPQAPELFPGRHAPLKQHPLEQVRGPQGLALQAPATHCSSELQVTQTLPPLPQAASPVVSTHWLPWQQPVQLFGPQGSEEHWPLTQRSAALQATHMVPPTPQVACVDTEAVTGMQAPLGSQHPGQVDGPQAPGPPSSSPQLAAASAKQANTTDNHVLLISQPP